MIYTAPLAALLCLVATPPQEDARPAPLPAEAPPHQAWAQATPAGAEMATYDVGDMTGAAELRELRDSVVRDDIPVVVRRAALDRYVELLESGSVEALTDQLVETVRVFIEPPLEGELERVIATAPGEITVAGRPEQQRWVREFLRSTRAFEGTIEFRMRIYEVPAGALRTLVEGRSGTILEPKKVGPFQEQIEALEGASVVSVPRVQARCASLANVTLVEQTAYVKDFELTVLPDLQKEIADPVIDVLETGIDVDVRGIPSAGGALAVYAGFRYSTADRPIRSQTLRIGASGHEVTVQLPELRVAKASARFDLAPGAAFVMATVDPGRSDSDAPRDIVFVLQALRASAKDSAAERDGR